METKVFKAFYLAIFEETQYNIWHMYRAPQQCPKCLANQNDWYRKKGYFKTKHNHQPVPRYQCKACHSVFSSHTNLETYRQKKPKLNQEIFKWYCSGLTQRRLAVVLKINRKTVARKFLFMASKARRIHEAYIASGEFKTSYIQFDEMETHEHSVLKPLSIAIAVRANTGEIIEAQVAQVQLKGAKTTKSFSKYGYRENQTAAVIEDVLKAIKQVSKRNTALYTDGDTSYPALMKKFIPNIDYKPMKNSLKGISDERRNKNDPLWRINHIAAKMRNDLSRLARKTWTTTKKIWALQAHIDLYIAWNNGYKI